MATLVQRLCVGNAKLFHCWTVWCFKLWKGLPSELLDWNVMKKRMANRQEFVVNVDKSLITEYDKDIEKLGVEIKCLHGDAPLSFKMRQIGFFMIRALVIIAACIGYPAMTCFLLGSLQFILLPYSLFVSIGYGIETSFHLFSGHALIFPIIKYFVDLLCPQYLNINIPFSPLFIIIFLSIDQIICTLCLFKTPQGPTKKMSLSRIWESVWYGFLNCKTYHLVLIPLLFGQSIPFTAWVIDAMLGVSGMISERMKAYWEISFYHTHRFGHINNVYPDAHKFHHWLHDTTAFDAHIFGSGAPEEWLLIITEYLMAVYLCGGIPPSMSYWVLGVTWYNKWGFHSRCVKPQYHAWNFHADHHLKHIVNYGYEYPLEMTMKTASGSNRDYIYNGYKIKRVESDNIISLQFTPCAQS